MMQGEILSTLYFEWCRMHGDRTLKAVMEDGNESDLGTNLEGTENGWKCRESAEVHES